jgi:hypothetical protein
MGTPRANNFIFILLGLGLILGAIQKFFGAIIWDYFNNFTLDCIDKGIQVIFQNL